MGGSGTASSIADMLSSRVNGHLCNRRGGAVRLPSRQTSITRAVDALRHVTLDGQGLELLLQRPEVNSPEWHVQSIKGPA